MLADVLKTSQGDVKLSYIWLAGRNAFPKWCGSIGDTISCSSSCFSLKYTLDAVQLPIVALPPEGATVGLDQGDAGKSRSPNSWALLYVLIGPNSVLPQRNPSDTHFLNFAQIFLPFIKSTHYQLHACQVKSTCTTTTGKMKVRLRFPRSNDMHGHFSPTVLRDFMLSLQHEPDGC